MVNSYTWFIFDGRKGMQGMSLEEEGGYRKFLDLLYRKNDQCLDDEQFIANWLECDVRVWRRIKGILLARNLVYVENGFIHDRKTQERIHREVSRALSQRNNGRLGGISKGVSHRPFQDKSMTYEKPSGGPVENSHGPSPSIPRKKVKSLLPSSVTPSEQAPGSLATAPLESALAHPACERPKGISGKSLTSAAIAPETDAEKAVRREAYLKHKAAQAERDRLADEAAKTEVELTRKNVAAGGHTARALADMEARKEARRAFENLRGSKKTEH